MKMEILTVDAILELKPKSWKVQVGNATPCLPFSNCEQVSEFVFKVPIWLFKKIEAAA